MISRIEVVRCLDDEVVTVSLDPVIEGGRRTIIRREAEADGWFNGPPYAVAEHVFDEYDQQPCAFDAEGNGEGNGETQAGASVRGPYSEALKILRPRRDAAHVLKDEGAAIDIPTDQV